MIVSVNQYIGAVDVPENVELISSDGNWFKFNINLREKGEVYHVEAKVFDDPSDYGINDGRVSKLNISKGERWTGFDNCVLNYDRGWDFDKAPEGLLQEILDMFP